MHWLDARGVVAWTLAIALVATGCGDDEGGSGGSAPTGTGTAGHGGSGAGGSGQGGTSTGTGGVGGSACPTWLVTYDLTGSTYHIEALMSFTITVQEPYSDDDKMGPGSLTLRFRDDGGSPATGSVAMVDYSLRQNFVTGISLAEVTTELQTSCGPDPCGVASGTLDGSTLTWTPPEAAPYCRDGQVSCTGSFCGSSGSPPEGQPFVFDNDCSTPLPLNAFVFDSGVGSFAMDPVQISHDQNQTTSLAFVGAEVDRQLDPATPSCACD